MNALPEKHSIMASEQEAKTDNTPVKDDQLSGAFFTSGSDIFSYLFIKANAFKDEYPHTNISMQILR